MSNNTPFDSVLQEGRVTSLAIPFWTKPGFAIPLIQSRIDSNATYVQRVNSDRKIVGFDTFRGGSRIIPLESTHEARVGDREVFALIDPNGDPYAGTRNELTPIVKNWVQDVDPPLLRMNFARFCGEEALAERSAAEAVKLKTSEFKNQEQAVRWFIDAVIIAELFNTLAETYVPQQEKARDRLFENALVSVRFNKGRLVIELPSALLDGKARLSKNRSFRLGKVLELARVATGRDLDLTAAATPRAAKTFDVTTQIRVDNVAAEINKLSRQEQRLSVLIRTILDDPPAGELLLSQYSDSAKFASNSARLLRGVLENAEDYSNLELQIAKVIPTLLTRAFPRQRGRLLVELAHGMSRHRRIASVIRGIVLKSRSNEIQSVREVVLKNLAE